MAKDTTKCGSCKAAPALGQVGSNLYTVCQACLDKKVARRAALRTGKKQRLSSFASFAPTPVPVDDRPPEATISQTAWNTTSPHFKMGDPATGTARVAFEGTDGPSLVRVEVVSDEAYAELLKGRA
jgi:hypothetical protein